MALKIFFCLIYAAVAIYIYRVSAKSVQKVREGWENSEESPKLKRGGSILIDLLYIFCSALWPVFLLSLLGRSLAARRKG